MPKKVKPKAPEAPPPGCISIPPRFWGEISDEEFRMIVREGVTQAQVQRIRQLIAEDKQQVTSS